MPIKSYLVHPHLGQKEELIKQLVHLEGCEVMPAQNQDVVILVTETDNKQEEESLQQKLEAIDSLQMLSMVSGFDT